jgi:eukaryotic-like serine/threonine-protein kinase
MGLWDKLQSLFSNEKLDVTARFELLGEGFLGTMSKFHKVRERRTNRILGLKICDPEKTEFFESRFRGLDKPSEGEIAAALQHPRIVRTLEYGVTTKEQSYILMEFLPGSGLHTLIRQRSDRLEGRRLELVRQMAEAVHAVHEAGYIHRDVCPRNFICSEEGSEIRLIDFGLTLPDKPAFRQPGNRTGTPMYMAPEIVRRRATDLRVDIFAFGVSAYHLLTFEHPWPNNDYSTGKGALAHDTDPPVPILEVRPQLQPVLAQAVSDCLDPNRDLRPAGLDVFLKRIRKVESEEAT